MDVLGIVTLIGGLFGIIGGLYKFNLWRQDQKRARENAAALSLEERRERAQPYLDFQARYLGTWRLFEFHRDLRMDIYVQEILEGVGASSPLSSLAVSASPINEDAIYRQLVGELAEADRQLVVLVGRAGSGKSTLLRHWALDLLAALRAPLSREQTPIPVFLALKHLSPALAGGELTSSDFARCFLRTIPGLAEEAAEIPFLMLAPLRARDGEPAEQPLSWIRRRLGSRQPPRYPGWIFFCDGLDELAAPVRPQLLRWIQALPSSVRAVLSTRPNILTDLGSLPRSRQYEVCDFNEKQIHQFVDQWFREEQDLARQFSEQIESKPALKRLAAIPLLLTCLSMDVEVRRAASFPADLLETQLLYRVVVILLDEWDASKSHRAVDWEFIAIAEALLTRLALERGVGASVTRAELLEMARACLQEAGRDPSQAAGIVERLLASGQILAESPEHRYSYNHAIFFDFFFARGAEHLIRQQPS